VLGNFIAFLNRIMILKTLGAAGLNGHISVMSAVLKVQ
jgi:hypothetical protein